MPSTKIDRLLGATWCWRLKAEKIEWKIENARRRNIVKSSRTLRACISAKVEGRCENAERKGSDAEGHLESAITESESLECCIRFRFSALACWSWRDFGAKLKQFKFKYYEKKGM